jgi:sugar O-acyltransferase (sialic acid O-acetyltransferase NeuD family)
MADLRRFVIWGSAGHAKVLADLLSLKGGEVIALFDSKRVEPAIAKVPLFVGEAGFLEWLRGVRDVGSIGGLVAIGGHHGRDRIGIQGLMQRNGLALPNIVHPQASVAATASLGAGTQVLAQAVVAADAQVGNACILNHKASVDHECTVGHGVHIAPGATLCGCVTVGDYVLVGAGAVVLPRLTIGADALIGAGAVVTRDVPAGARVMGNPARPSSRS